MIQHPCVYILTVAQLLPGQGPGAGAGGKALQVHLTQGPFLAQQRGGSQRRGACQASQSGLGHPPGPSPGASWPPEAGTGTPTCSSLEVPLGPSGSHERVWVMASPWWHMAPTPVVHPTPAPPDRYRGAGNEVWGTMSSPQLEAAGSAPGSQVGGEVSGPLAWGCRGLSPQGAQTSRRRGPGPGSHVCLWDSTG